MKVMLSTTKWVCLESFFEYLKRGMSFNEICIRMDITKKELLDFIDWMEATIEESESKKYD